MNHAIAEHRRLTSLLAVLLSVAALPLGAQTSERPGEVQHRNDCRLAAQVLRTGEPRTKFEWARGYVSACADEGPVLLGQAWRIAPADSSEARYLIRHTSRLRDGRLFADLLRTAANRGRPDVIRVASMLVLLRYANPDHALMFGDVAAPAMENGRIPLVRRWRTGGNQLPGAVPVPSAATGDILELLDGISTSRSESRAVSYAAAVIAKRLRADVETGQAR